MGYDTLIDTKISREVRQFLDDLAVLDQDRAAEARKNWEAYVPHLKKCGTKQELALMLMTFFKRSLKSVRSAEPKKFSKFRYKAVGRLMNCLYALRLNKNQVGDYIRHLHQIKAEAGEERYDKEQFMREYRESEKKKKITLEQLRGRLKTEKKSAGFDIEKFAAAGAVVSSVLYILLKLLKT